MKRIIQFFLVLLWFFLFGRVVVDAINNQNEGFRIIKNIPQEVRVHGDCKKVANFSDIGDAFVPTRSIEEWDVVKTRHPSHIQLSDCTNLPPVCENVALADLGNVVLPATQVERSAWREKIANLPIVNTGISWSEYHKISPLIRTYETSATKIDPPPSRWWACSKGGEGGCDMWGEITIVYTNHWEVKTWVFPNNSTPLLLSLWRGARLVNDTTEWYIGRKWNSYACAWKKLQIPDIVSSSPPVNGCITNPESCIGVKPPLLPPPPPPPPRESPPCNLKMCGAYVVYESIFQPKK